IPASGSRDIRVAGTLSNQGGATDCAVPFGSKGAFINVIAVLPSAPGNLLVYPWGTSAPNASTLNYAGGDVIANGVLVPICTEASATRSQCVFDLTVASGATSHVVIDITGYLVPPQ